MLHARCAQVPISVIVASRSHHCVWGRAPSDRLCSSALREDVVKQLEVGVESYATFTACDEAATLTTCDHVADQR